MAISSVDGLNQCPLPDEHLIDVQEDVAALNNHSLDGQILSNVFCLTHLVEQGWQCNSLKYFGFFFGLSSRPPQNFFGITPQTPRWSLGQNVTGQRFSANSDVVSTLGET